MIVACEYIKIAIYRSVSIGHRRATDLGRDIWVVRRLFVRSRGLFTNLCNVLMEPCYHLLQLFDFHIPNLDRLVPLLQNLVNISSPRG